MESKFSKLSKALIESSWLAALLVVPLFFNIRSSRIFEQDKIAILRTLALFVVAVWLGLGIENWIYRGEETPAPVDPFPSPWAQVKKHPLLWVVLALIGSYLISTLLSVVPKYSLWGSYIRAQGTYTTLAYVTMFFAAVMFVTHLRQIERIMWAMVAASFPAALYGVWQHYGFDPITWHSNVEARAISTAGNSIFLGAFLIMTFFATIGLMTILLTHPRGKPSWQKWSLFALLLIALLIEALGILFTESRGPWMGWMVGLYVFVLMALVSLRLSTSVSRATRKLWIGWIGIGAVGAAFIIVLNLPNTPLKPLTKNRYIYRLSTVLQSQSGTGKVRDIVWQGGLRIFLPHDPIKYADGGRDTLNLIRPLVGYGPETQIVMYQQFYPPELAHYEKRNAIPDRSHNETFDALVTTGLLGFLAETALFLLLFYYSLTWLGLISTQSHRIAFSALMGAGGVLGAALPPLVGRPEFLGIGIPIGLVLALIVYVTWAAAFQRKPVTDGKLSLVKHLLLITFLSIIIAHYVETLFGIPVASTRLYFWVTAGMLLAVGLRWDSLIAEEERPEKTEVRQGNRNPAQERSSSSRKRRRKSRSRAKQVENKASVQAKKRHPISYVSVVVLSLLSGLILMTLAYAIMAKSVHSSNVGTIIAQELTKRFVNNKPQNAPGGLWLMFVTWAFLWFFAILQHKSQEKGNAIGEWINRSLIYIIVSASITSFFVITQASKLADIARATRSSKTFEQMLDLITHLLVTYYVWMFIVVILVAVALWWQRTRKGDPWSYGGVFSWLGTGFLILVMLAVAWHTNVRIVQADMYYKIGQKFENRKKIDEALISYKKALSKRKEGVYYLAIARMESLEAKKNTKDPKKMEAWFRSSEKHILLAHEFLPLDGEYLANTARLYRSWALREKDKDTKRKYFQKSLEFYEKAIVLNPNTASLWNELGSAYLALGEREKALQTYQHSLEIDSRFDDTYIRLARWYKGERNWEKASEMYLKAVEVRPSANTYKSLALVYLKEGKKEKAIDAYLQALKLNPKDWQTDRSLAILYRDQGDVEKALQHAREAENLAPKSSKESLKKLIEELEKK